MGEFFVDLSTLKTEIEQTKKLNERESHKTEKITGEITIRFEWIKNEDKFKIVSLIDNENNQEEERRGSIIGKKFVAKKKNFGNLIIFFFY